MEILIPVTILLFFWTNDVLFGNGPKKKEKTKTEKLADALADYLKEGVNVNINKEKAINTLM
ncbi:MAG: hypothetical protein HC922_05720 [Leptolyngbyaceae cyanobacterium SM2_3_12]|nr:hypothetical protein [Leptolyngbyaceae cyanobacterium SM2_3_12]